MEDNKGKFRREVITWTQYFVISLLAAVWAYDSFISKSTGPIAEGIDINALGMIRVMWHTYLLPFVCAFAVLSALRLLFLFLSGKRGKKNDVVTSGTVVARE